MKFIGDVDVEGNLTVNGEEVGSGGSGLYVHNLTIRSNSYNNTIQGYETIFVLSFLHSNNTPITSLSMLATVLLKSPSYEHPVNGTGGFTESNARVRAYPYALKAISSNGANILYFNAAGTPSAFSIPSSGYSISDNVTTL